MKKSYKRSGTGRGILVPVLVGLLILLTLFRRNKSTSKTSQQRELIKNLLVANGYSERVGTWWGAISHHETAGWTSPLSVKVNNWFGMKQPIQRDTLSQGPVDWTGRPNPNDSPDNQYASFPSGPENSVKDLVLYMKAKNYPKDFDSVDQLIRFMKSKVYFTAPEAAYLASVKARL